MEWRLPDSLFSFLTRGWSVAQFHQLRALLADVQLSSGGVYQLADGERIRVEAVPGQSCLEWDNHRSVHLAAVILAAQWHQGDGSSSRRRPFRVQKKGSFTSPPTKLFLVKPEEPPPYSYHPLFSFRSGWMMCAECSSVAEAKIINELKSLGQHLDRLRRIEPADPVSAWQLADECAVLEEIIFEACLSKARVYAPFAHDGIVVGPQGSEWRLYAGDGSHAVVQPLQPNELLVDIGFGFGVRNQELVPLGHLDKAAHYSPHEHGWVLLDGAEQARFLKATETRVTRHVGKFVGMPTEAWVANCTNRECEPWWGTFDEVLLSAEGHEPGGSWRFTILQHPDQRRPARPRRRRVDERVALNEDLYVRLNGEMSQEGFATTLCLETADNKTVHLTTILSAFWSGKKSLTIHGRCVELPASWLERHATALYDWSLLSRLHKSLIPWVAISPLLELLACLQVHAIEYMPHQADVEGIRLPDYLRTYQQEGVRWLFNLYSQGLGGLIADDMGLGKTIQMLTLLDRVHSSNKPGEQSLIVVPTSVIDNWIAECQRFTPALKMHKYYGSKRRLCPETPVVITTYAVLRKDIGTLSKPHWRVIAVDEAQNLKTPTSQTAKACRRLNAHCRFAMTGTPFENSLDELWSVTEFVVPGLLGGRRTFLHLFRSLSDGASGEARARQIGYLQRCIQPYLLRRLKNSVLNELPPREVQYVECEMGNKQALVYRDYESAGRRRIGYRIAKEGFHKVKFAFFEIMMRLRQIAADPTIVPGIDTTPSSKRAWLRQFLPEQIRSGHRFLVFSQWTSLLKNVCADLEDLGIDFLYLDGRTRDRLGLQETWNTESGPSVFLISLTAGGTGLNLTGADRVVLLDPWWNPAIENQAMDRAYRIGQERPVITYKVITRGTIEARVIRTQDRKRGLFDALIDGQSSAKPLMAALFAEEAESALRVSDKEPSDLPQAAQDALALHGMLTSTLLGEALGISGARARRMLKNWRSAGLLIRKGRRQNTRYYRI